MFLAHFYSQPSLLFSGRMKTVTNKQVSYERYKSQHCFWQESGRHDGPFIVPAVTTGGGVAAAGILAALQTPTPLSGIVGAVLAGFSVPAGSGLTASIMDRRVTYWKAEIPMSPEEEWAVMSPLERAHSQVDAALNKWAVTRKLHQKNLVAMQTHWKKLEEERKFFAQSLETSQNNASENNTDVQMTYEVNRLSIQLEIKTKACEEQKKLLELATQMFETLQQAILVQERTLYETKEALETTAQRHLLLKMNQDIQSVTGQNQESQTLQEVQNKDLEMALETQKVEIEALMASIKTAMDVDAVLKSVSQDGQHSTK